MEFKHDGPTSLRLGIVIANGVKVHSHVPLLDSGIQKRLKALEHGLSSEEDAFRSTVRDIFRNGSFKPTGRSKPASEYLLRAASEGAFPRINTLVDCCNFLSLGSLLPISIWDTSAAISGTYVFRLGTEGESYVFNPAGHSIDLKDLVVGCSMDTDGISVPIVNPVKDSMGTKTGDSTLAVAAAVYAPLSEGPGMTLQQVCQTFVEILMATDPMAHASFRILGAGEHVRI